MKSGQRRWITVSFGLLAVVAIALVGPPAVFLAKTAWTDSPPGQFTLPAGVADDVSHLNAIPVAEVWSIPAQRDAAESQLRDLLGRARETGRRVSIAGARHSMGGHTLYPDGIVVDMRPFRSVQVDGKQGLLTAGAGALWSEILPEVDAAGWSIGVMQSDSTFTVGGSLSVNCHGWAFGKPPIASTVESFRLMRADGSIVRCSREENRELFGLALGGYGLFGIILEAELRLVPNVRLRLDQFGKPTPEGLVGLERLHTSSSPPSMVYARLNITPDHRFESMRVNAYYPEPGQPIPDIQLPGALGLRRAIFRGSANSDYGKKLRWLAETRLQPSLLPNAISRNALLEGTPDWYLNRSTNATDILHEYFVPRSATVEFLRHAAAIITRHQGDLLNTTVRDVAEDSDTFLRYAREPVTALVMFFNQARTPEAESRMEAMTRELIDAVLERGGCYYLPYRLHATPDQFYRAYPQAREFFRKKRELDPGALFQNQFYRRYGTSDQANP